MELIALSQMLAIAQLIAEAINYLWPDSPADQRSPSDDRGRWQLAFSARSWRALTERHEIG